MERYQLAIDRLREIHLELQKKSRDAREEFMYRLCDFVNRFEILNESLRSGEYFRLDLEALKEMQMLLYADVMPGAYETSIYNPAHLSQSFDAPMARALSVLAYETRSLIKLGYENEPGEIVKIYELILEVYTALSDDATCKQVEEILYYYVSDYMDEALPKALKYRFTNYNRSFHDLFRKLDQNELSFEDPRYLFYFGEYVSDTELNVSAFLSQLSQEEIDKMADTFTEGFRLGFVAGRKDLSRKKALEVFFPLGFERVAAKSIQNFETMGLFPILYRNPYRLGYTSAGRKAGISSTSVNKQMEYDHRFDNYIFMDKAFVDRRLTILRSGYEQIKPWAREYAGPALMEVFGEELFEPKNNPFAPELSAKQKELNVRLANESSKIQSEYIIMEERSFTIIAWPLPTIANSAQRYEEIFKEIIRINTLDYQKYQNMQQILIDTLDRADHVVVAGGENNETRISVKLHELKNPSKETNFENCVADVNIPVGEVFTSPVLKGTNGLLHVNRVYIGDIKFLNLKLWFEDGMVTRYSCSNFPTKEENEKLIEDVLLKNHKSLPMGEFAIGTNTVAYQVAKKYDILDKLPILIAEKMGPHFAIGDTCYSFEEDSVTYNPDGKAIVARENEVSALRKVDFSKAYLNCHTDITIPYDELGDIYAVDKSGEIHYIVKDSKFVLPGLADLNI